jgi:hypothetical protein
MTNNIAIGKAREKFGQKSEAVLHTEIEQGIMGRTDHLLAFDTIRMDGDLMSLIYASKIRTPDE